MLCESVLVHSSVYMDECVRSHDHSVIVVIVLFSFPVTVIVVIVKLVYTLFFSSHCILSLPVMASLTKKIATLVERRSHCLQDHTLSLLHNVLMSTEKVS